MERSTSQIKYIRAGSPWEDGPVRELPDAKYLVQAAVDFLKNPREKARRKEFIENMNA